MDIVFSLAYCGRMKNDPGLLRILVFSLSVVGDRPQYLNHMGLSFNSFTVFVLYSILVSFDPSTRELLLQAHICASNIVLITGLDLNSCYFIKILLYFQVGL